MYFIQKIQHIIFLCSMLYVLPVSASISVQLASPHWDFLIHHFHEEARDITLTSGERSFARDVQQLFNEDKTVELMKKFNSRDYQHDSPALLLLRGQVLLSLKAYTKAEQVLLTAIKKHANFALAHRSLSSVYLFNQAYEKAAEHLAKTIELGVADAQAYGQLGYVHLQLNQAASAIAGYQYALFLEPDNTQWKQGLLFALIETQAFDQAQAIVDEMLQKSPRNSQLWLQRSQIALNKGRNKQAISSIEAALSLGIKDANNVAFAAQLHIQNGSSRRAVELLSQHSHELIAANKINELDQIAQWLVFDENWSQLTTLVNAIDINQQQISAFYRSRLSLYQAKVALSEGNKKAQKLRARQYLQKAITTDPGNGEALLTLANVLQALNHNEQASIYFTRAQALHEFTERALLGRAQLAINRQQYSDALRFLRQVIQQNPLRTDILVNIQSLESLVRSKS